MLKVKSMFLTALKWPIRYMVLFCSNNYLTYMIEIILLYHKGSKPIIEINDIMTYLLKWDTCYSVHGLMDG